jgi:hypothetical protein
VWCTRFDLVLHTNAVPDRPWAVCRTGRKSFQAMLGAVNELMNELLCPVFRKDADVALY